MKTTFSLPIIALLLGFTATTVAEPRDKTAATKPLKPLILKDKKPLAAPAKTDKVPGIRRVVGKDGKTTYVLDTTELVGVVQRPRAYYVLQRTRMADPLPPLQRKLAPRILESVGKTPF